MQDKEKEESHQEAGGGSTVQKEALSEVIFQTSEGPANMLMILTIGIL